jgi:hypothetical protein
MFILPDTILYYIDIESFPCHQTTDVITWFVVMWDVYLRSFTRFIINGFTFRRKLLTLMYLQLNLQQAMSEIVIKYYMSHNLGNIYGRNWHDWKQMKISCFTFLYLSQAFTLISIAIFHCLYLCSIIWGERYFFFFFLVYWTNYWPSLFNFSS